MMGNVVTESVGSSIPVLRVKVKIMAASTNSPIPKKTSMPG